MERQPDFYVVLRDDDWRLHRHDDFEKAKREATRLAGENRPHRFFILQATHCAAEERPPICVRQTDDGIPF